MAEGISIPWNGGDVIAGRKARKSLENAKKIRAKSVSTGTDHAFEILGECSRDQPVCPFREVGTSQSTMTSQGNLGLPHPSFTTMDMPPLQTQVIRSPGQPPASWNKAPGANSVTPQVIATAALPALARQVKEVEQRNPRKQSAACQSAKTTAQRAAGNRDNEEQIAATLRECNALKSNVIKTASDDDSTQDISLGSNQAARRQSTVTWASNVAETQSDRPQFTLAKPD